MLHGVAHVKGEDDGEERGDMEQVAEKDAQAVDAQRSQLVAKERQGDGDSHADMPQVPGAQCRHREH